MLPATLHGLLFRNYTSRGCPESNSLCRFAAAVVLECDLVVFFFLSLRFRSLHTGSDASMEERKPLLDSFVCVYVGSHTTRGGGLDERTIMFRVAGCACGFLFADGIVLGILPFSLCGDLCAHMHAFTPKPCSFSTEHTGRQTNPVRTCQFDFCVTRQQPRRRAINPHIPLSRALPLGLILVSLCAPFESRRGAMALAQLGSLLLTSCFSSLNRGVERCAGGLRFGNSSPPTSSRRAARGWLFPIPAKSPLHSFHAQYPTRASPHHLAAITLTRE